MKRIIWLVGMLLLLVAPGAHGYAPIRAQEATEVRFYLVPMDRIVFNGTPYRGAKYFPWQPARLGVSPVPEMATVTEYSVKDYGAVDIGVVAANLTAAQEAFMAAQTDVYVWPANLDVNAAQADLNALKTYLDTVAVPSDWITGSETYRGALRTITGMFLFMQNFSANLGYQNPLGLGITLNTHFDQLDATVQNALLLAYSNLGYDASFITANMTVRQILKNTADQWGAKPIYFGSIATL